MPDQFLHGIETVQIDDGIRPIRTARSSVIGIVGTAPDADEAAFPYDKPILITGPRMAATLGAAGTLLDAYNAAYAAGAAARAAARATNAARAAAYAAAYVAYAAYAAGAAADAADATRAADAAIYAAYASPEHQTERQQQLDDFVAVWKEMRKAA